MTDREENHGRPGDDNQRIGKELYNQDKRRQQERNSYRGPENKSWDEGNNFHTGPSPRGAQDRYQEHESNRGGAGNSSYNQGQNAHLNDHYGSRQNSAYRNDDNQINYGDRRDQGARRNQSNRSDERDPSKREVKGNAGGSQPGNYNELPESPDKLHREGPGTRSRYKESDYRYGSGSHNWYTEGRYTPDEDRNSRDDRGFFDRVRDGWNDIMHSDDPDYQQRGDQGNDRRRAEELSSRKRYGGEHFRDRHYDNGYEGGPRWADETDSGKDNQYRNEDRDQRYRR